MILERTGDLAPSLRCRDLVSRALYQKSVAAFPSLVTESIAVPDAPYLPALADAGFRNRFR